jgi:urate oxidase
MTRLGTNSYGKSRIRLVKVVRHGDRHDVKDLTVAVRLEGDFEEAHIAGDNRKVLPTDSMKNTVYALAAGVRIDQIEQFGIALAAHFLRQNPQVSRARIEIAERIWTRLPVGGRPHNHAFMDAGGERRTASVTSNGERVSVVAGIDGLQILKTSGSAFAGFLKDPFTTLRETRDRIFATTMTAKWTYIKPEVTFGPYWLGVRQALLETFSAHDSQSVQHTLYAMADAVLSAYEEIAEITLKLPNRHHLPVDLSPFGLDDKNEIFVATEEPHGVIEATVSR